LEFLEPVHQIAVFANPKQEMFIPGEARNRKQLQARTNNLFCKQWPWLAWTFSCFFPGD